MSKDVKDTKPKSNQKAKSEDSVLKANTVISLTVPWEKAEEAYKKALSGVASNLKLPGFRKGKVPPHIAEAQLDRAAVIERALEKVLPEIYREAVEKAKVIPITQPDIKPLSLDWGKDWQLEAQIAVEPEIDLANYKKIVEKGKKEGELELAKQEKELAEHIKEHEAEKKKAEKDGKTVADHHHSHELSESQKQDIRLQSIFKALVTELKPQIQELLVREQTRYELNHLVQTLQSSKLTLDDYLKRRGQSFEDLSAELAAASLGQLQLEYILKAIVTQEKLQPTETEIDEFLKEAKQTDEKNPSLRNYVTQHLTRKKVIDHLLGNTTSSKT